MIFPWISENSNFQTCQCWCENTVEANAIFIQSISESVYVNIQKISTHPFEKKKNTNRKLSSCRIKLIKLISYHIRFSYSCLFICLSSFAFPCFTSLAHIDVNCNFTHFVCIYTGSNSIIITIKMLQAATKRYNSIEFLF